MSSLLPTVVYSWIIYWITKFNRHTGKKELSPKDLIIVIFFFTQTRSNRECKPALIYAKISVCIK